MLALLATAAPLRLATWTSWANCGIAVFFVLFLGQRVWLPEYHARFGLRRQVEISAEYEQEEWLPMASYPKQWDSISFYTQRKDIESYAGPELHRLVHDIRKHGRALVFVKRAGSLEELKQALPADMQLDVLDYQGDFVAVALVRGAKD